MSTSPHPKHQFSIGVLVLWAASKYLVERKQEKLFISLCFLAFSSTILIPFVGTGQEMGILGLGKWNTCEVKVNTVARCHWDLGDRGRDSGRLSLEASQSQGSENFHLNNVLIRGNKIVPRNLRPHLYKQHLKCCCEYFRCNIWLQSTLLNCEIMYSGQWTELN